MPKKQFSLFVTVNLSDDTEREWQTVPEWMEQNKLEDTLSDIIDANRDVDSFMFEVVQRNA